MSKEELDAALTVAMTILGGAVGGFVIMVVGNRLRGASAAAIKRKRFKSYFCLLRRRIDGRGADDFMFDPSAREIRELDKEAFEIRHCIQGRLVGKFDAALAAYKAVRFDMFSGPDLSGQQERDSANQKAKNELLFYIDEIAKCAWWAV